MPEVTTIIFSGGATERAPATVRDFRGGSLRISHVAIDDHVAYAQQSARHLLHVPLAIGGSRSGGQALSFTPADRERRGRTGRGEITGLEVGFEDWFIEEACEQSVRASLSTVENRRDAKCFVMAETIASLSTPAAFDRIAYDTMLVALARNLGQSYGNAPKRSDDAWLHPRALARVIEQLRSDPARSIRLGDLASEAGLSVSAFIRAFRGSVGVTPAAFSQRTRLEEAARLLRRTELTVGEIGSRCGFATASHFISAFRASRGVTPVRWRREQA